MQNTKIKIEKNIFFLIEKVGKIINPIILKFTNEKNKLLIFYFHGVYDSEKQKNLNHVDPQNNVTVSQLTDFIEYFLQHNYHFIKPADLSKSLPKGKSYIMITFDDGYFNNLLAINILNKYKIPGTFFITTNNILHNTSYWWDIIYKYRLKDGVSLEKIRKEQGYLKAFKYSFINNYIKENFGDKAWEPWSDIDRPFTPKELNTISTDPFVTLGNHTANHSILTNYSFQEIKEELLTANKTLADITGKEPDTVAFPNGNFNSEVLDITKELKFQFAFTTINKLNTLPFNNDNLICLNRFMAKPASVKSYASLNRLGYNPDSLYASIKKGLIPQKK